jgi:hypothetical protein
VMQCGIPQTQHHRDRDRERDKEITNKQLIRCIQGLLGNILNYSRVSIAWRLAIDVVTSYKCVTSSHLENYKLKLIELSRLYFNQTKGVSYKIKVMCTHL